MKRAPPRKVRNVLLFKSRDFVWLLSMIIGNATKLSGWARGRENDEVFGPLEPTSFPWFVLPCTWANR